MPNRASTVLLAALTLVAAPVVASAQSSQSGGSSAAAKPASGQTMQGGMMDGQKDGMMDGKKDGMMEGQMDGMMHPAGGAAIKPVYDAFKGYVLAAAQQVPEGDYGYAPTSGVRTFGQLFGHIANSNFAYCSRAGAGESPSKGDVEKMATSKAEVFSALKASFAFCDAAYSLPDTELAGEVELYGAKRSKLAVLDLNAAHIAEHYGNLVTYLRLKQMVPPSSQGN